MDILNRILQDAIKNPIATLFILLFLFLLSRRILTNVRVYFGTKSYVKKTASLRRGKQNGNTLLEKILKKRKRKSNCFQYLRRSAKKKVELYFEYKQDELPGITNYSFGKMLKRNKHKLIIFVSNGKKKVKKIHVKNAKKAFIELTNEYDCLNEFIQYLHNLPEALLNREDYDIFLEQQEISIGYQVK